jgi:hypothetical protein
MKRSTPRSGGRGRAATRLALSALALALALARGAAAEPTTEPAAEPTDGAGPAEPADDRRLAERVGLAVVGDGRVIAGVGSVSNLTLVLAGAGVELPVAPTLTARGTLLGMVPIGSVEGGEPARAGAGGELSLRLTPWPEWSVRPYARWGMGLMLFREPFLPGGTRYDGILTLATGVEWQLGQRWTVGLDASSVHLSNGQGLGDHNPAYDGFGVTLAAARSLAPRRVPDRADWPELTRGARDSATPGITAEATVGEVGSALLVSGRALVAQRIAEPLLVQLDAEGGELADEPFAEIGGDLAAHLGAVSLAPHVGYRRFVGFDTLVLGFQGELHIHEVSVVGMVHHERNEVFGTLWRAGFGLRAYPIPDVLVELGIGFDQIGDDTIQDSSDPYLGFEWRVPVGGDTWQLSLRIERQISTINLAALRVSWGMGPTLAELGRRHGFRRVR